MTGIVRLLRATSVLVMLWIPLLHASAKLTPQGYIEQYCQLAVKEMKRSGVPASITLAQGMLESNNGNSTLAVDANNHFGIKCHNDWNGKTLHQDDDRANECFRKYPSVLDSYIDHSNFLRERSRYQFLFELKTTDYKGWAHGLKKAGYATDPHYATRLIDLIENYELYKFDSDVDPAMILADDDFAKKPGKKVDNFVIDMGNRHEVGYNNGVRYITVQPGDSFASISDEFGMRQWEIFHYNDIAASAKIQDYKYLYIQPKRAKAHSNHSFHTVKQGETMHYISQKYGIRIKRLYKLNQMDPGTQPKSGDKLYLRTMKK